MNAALKGKEARLPAASDIGDEDAGNGDGAAAAAATADRPRRPGPLPGNPLIDLFCRQPGRRQPGRQPRRQPGR